MKISNETVKEVALLQGEIVTGSDLSVTGDWYAGKCTQNVTKITQSDGGGGVEFVMRPPTAGAEKPLYYERVDSEAH